MTKDLDSRNWYRYGSPRGFYPLAGRLIPWFAIAAAIACAAGLYLGLFVVPVDANKAEVARIMFVCIPASWVEVIIFLAMAASAGIGLRFNSPLAQMAAQALAPTGLLFSFLDIWTDSLWIKPVWGFWWVWDLRTAADLTLILLFIGFIGMHIIIEDLHRANKAGFLVLLAGVLAVPAYALSAHTWPVRYQPSLLDAAGAGELASLLAVSLGFLMYSGAVVLLRLRCVILEGERQGDLVAKLCGRAP
ncbi:MAG: heme ABC transporter permease [Burkholderiales bacterium]|nr:heme ABC transporter permease [Burkholderiales bacterium]